MRYGVIGGGALGLTAALRLTERGHAVTLLERELVPGGLAGSFEVAPGVWLEKFYHHLFATDRSAVGLIRELGLEHLLRWHRTRSTVFVDGRIERFDSPASVLAFKPLPLTSRLRLAAGLAYLRALPSPVGLETATAGRWMRRVMGSRAYDTVWAPLLHGKFGSYADEVTMAWLWARIHCRTAELGYLRGGFHQLYRALSARLVESGAEVIHGAEAAGIRSHAGCIEVTMRVGGDERVEAFDRVVSTLPTALTVRLTPELDAEYAARHPAPAALGAHCLVLDLDRRLTDAYWIAVNDPGMPFLAAVEHTNMVPAAEYDGAHLVYLGNYRPHDDPIFSASLDELIDQAEPGLRRLAPAFDRSWIRRSWSFKAPFAQPVVTVGFKHMIPGFSTPVPGLFVANMFQVYPYDRGQNYSIELAERLVAHLERAA